MIARCSLRGPAGHRAASHRTGGPLWSGALSLRWFVQACGPP